MPNSKFFQFKRGTADTECQLFFLLGFISPFYCFLRFGSLLAISFLVKFIQFYRGQVVDKWL